MKTSNRPKLIENNCLAPRAVTSLFLIETLQNYDGVIDVRHFNLELRSVLWCQLYICVQPTFDANRRGRLKLRIPMLSAHTSRPRQNVHRGFRGDPTRRETTACEPYATTRRMVHHNN